MMMDTNVGSFTAGADPELFLKKEGRYVSVQPYVTGTKKNPQPLPYGGNAQRDNAAIEFGIIPASTKREFVMNIGNTIGDLIDILPKGVTLDPVASAQFSGRELRHKECKMFGCDEDRNAWTMQVNPTPNIKENRLLRSCGGHVHIGHVIGSGYGFLLDDDGAALFIRALDCTAGIMSTVLDDNIAALERRKLYGKAGCYRKTDYGVEYRTLSNYWIKSPRLVELIYHLVKDTLSIVKDGESSDLLGLLGVKEVQLTINNSDAEKAQSMVDEVVVNFLSADTIQLFQQCLPAINTYNFLKEWENV